MNIYSWIENIFKKKLTITVWRTEIFLKWGLPRLSSDQTLHVLSLELVTNRLFAADIQKLNIEVEWAFTSLAQISVFALFVESINQVFISPSCPTEMRLASSWNLQAVTPRSWASLTPSNHLYPDRDQMVMAPPELCYDQCLGYWPKRWHK